MDAATRELVRRRAGNRCEYCNIPQAATPLISFHVEHVVAQQHARDDSPDNLALACDRCNAYKGPNLSSIDPESGNVVNLFNPRKDAWSDHFALVGGEVLGLTAAGRATAELLNVNAPRRAQLRRDWAVESGDA